jgi:hypothetical protein
VTVGSKYRVGVFFFVDVQAPLAASLANEAWIFADPSETALTDVLLGVVGYNVNLATRGSDHTE